MTFGEFARSIDRHPEHFEWHKWFAWYPVPIKPRGRGWLWERYALGRTVERKYSATYEFEWWNYREVARPGTIPLKTEMGCRVTFSYIWS